MAYNGALDGCDADVEEGVVAMAAMVLGGGEGEVVGGGGWDWELAGWEEDLEDGLEEGRIEVEGDVD